MEPVTLTVTKKLTIKLYEDLYREEFRKSVRVFPFKWIIGVFVVLTATGIFLRNYFLIATITCAASAFVLYLGFYFSRYLFVMKQLRRQLEKQFIHDVFRFDFRFDETGIYKSAGELETKTHWEEIVAYSENSNALHLFGKEAAVKDIISKEILGERMFTDFVLLTRKMVKNL